jgi:hypothetical protein
MVAGNRASMKLYANDDALFASVPCFISPKKKTATVYKDKGLKPGKAIYLVHSIRYL